MPLEQKNQIWKSINHGTIIKILKDDTLMNDCVQYKHYLAWYHNDYARAADTKTILVASNLAVAS